MLPSSIPVRLLMISLFCSAAGSAVAADNRLSTRAEVQYAEDARPPVTASVNDAGTDYASANVTRPGLFGAAQARASYGFLDIEGVATATTLGGVAAIADALWTDVLSFQIFAEQPWSGTAPAFNASITVTGGGDLSGGISGLSGFDPVVFSGPGTFEFGGLIQGPVEITVALGGRASVAGREASDAFVGSVRWNGITGIGLPGSSENPRFTVTSASGLDYALAAPIPEPQTVLLMLLGMAGIAARASSATAKK